MDSTSSYLRTAVMTILFGTVAAWFPGVSNLLLAGTKSHGMYAASVNAGLQKGMEECRRSFFYDRWNCQESTLSSLYNLNHRPSREMSYVHAISAAGVMYVLTKNCSEGAFLKCGCDDSKTGQIDEDGWTWGGCSDNVKFGEKISRQFIDTIEVGRDAQSVMNIHNNDAGRKAVRSTLEKRCKCHGVSGSCTLQTCWMQLSDFSTIGRYLRKKYFTATLVDGLDVDLIEGESDVAITDDVTVDVTAPELNKRGLVYLEESPDYCSANDTMGFAGMVGRECIKKNAIDTSLYDEDEVRWLKDSCQRICTDCGLRVRKKKVVETTNCNCVFQWCCSVKCDTCRKKVTKHYCHPKK